MTRSNGKLLLMYVLLGPGLLVAAIGGNELYGRRLVRHELALCREAGMTLDCVALYGPPVPRDQNAAPLFQQAFDRWSEARDSMTPALEHDEELAEGFLDMRRVPHKEDVLAGGRRLLDHYDSALRRWDGAAQKAACRFEPVIALESPIEGYGLTGNFRMNRLLRVRAAVAYHAEGPDAACDGLEEALRSWRLLNGHPLLVSSVVELGVVQAHICQAEYLLECGGQVSAPAWRRLLEALPRSDEIRNRSRRAVCGELTGFLQPSFRQQRAEWLRVTRLWDWEQEAQEIRVCRILWQALRASPQEAATTHWPDDPWFYQTRDIWGNWVSSGWSSTAERYLWYSVGRTVAQVDLVRLGAALEVYRAEQGSYPRALGPELVPLLGGEVPRDPFDGAPMRYRRDGDDGCAVWSVGADRTDDGGIGAFAEAMEDGTDVVVRLGRTAAEALAEQWREDWQSRKGQIEYLLGSPP